MKKVIYIMGAGRSGTTLLDIILGNSEDIFSAGELNRLPKRNGIPPKRDPDSDVYKFWESLSNHVLEKQKKESFNDLFKLTDRLEYHSSILKFVSKKDKESYAIYIKSLYALLSDEINEKFIVDSSKYPMKAYRMVDFVDEFHGCIYLKRHPVSVVKSFQKSDVEQPSNPWYIANIYLIIVGIVAWFTIRKMRKKGVKIIEIKYEELVSKPSKVLGDIEEKLDVDLSHSIRKVENKENFSTGMMFDGNRIRLNTFIDLRNNSKVKDKWSFYDYIVYSSNLFWWKS